MLRSQNLIRIGYSLCQFGRKAKPSLFINSCLYRCFSSDTSEETENERMDYDVVIVGGGCSGLSTAIRLKKEAAEHNLDLSVCILEKGESIGSHILSGCLMNTTALSKLIPDWMDRNSPIKQKVEKESIQWMINEKSSYSIPSFLLPKPARHSSSYIVSLSNVCRWLASIAEEEGVDIFPDISVSKVITNEKNEVIGVKTQEKGISKKGKPKEDYQPGYSFYSKCLVLAEGALGSLTEQVIQDYHLQSSYPRTYGLGIKEIWEIPEEEMKKGQVLHTVGYPLQHSLFDSIYGGGFAYYEQPNYLHIGLITGLDYHDASLSPYEEFQLFKQSPSISPLLTNGKRLEYGARVIYEGGKLGQCKPIFPGGCIVGDSLGVVNMASLQGTDNAIENGILLADSLIQNWQKVQEGKSMSFYEDSLKQSDLMKQLHNSRSLRALYEKGLFWGMAYAFLTGTLFGNHTFVTHSLSKGEDYEKTYPVDKSIKLPSRNYCKYDNKRSFSRESSLVFSNLSYPQDQLSHITRKQSVPVDFTFSSYQGIEEQFCPAHVYEYITKEDGSVEFQIHHENCLHCKTCVIKTPKQAIEWKPPCSGGPNYSNM